MREGTNSTIMRSARPVVVVTGASAGVGRATAVEFGRHGWRVALIARGHDRLESARSAVDAAGGEAIALPADVSDADAVFAVADNVIQRWGKIDAWINNAMVTLFAPVDLIT